MHNLSVARNAMQFACEADPQVMMKKRTKLLSNVNNCLAIMGPSSDDGSQLDDADRAVLQSLSDLMIAETEACYKAANLPYHSPGDRSVLCVCHH
jgi:hypothetical protein